MNWTDQNTVLEARLEQASLLKKVTDYQGRRVSRALIVVAGG